MPICLLTRNASGLAGLGSGKMMPTIEHADGVLKGR